MKYDYIEVAPYTYKIVEKGTQEPVDIIKIITENFERGDYKK